MPEGKIQFEVTVTITMRYTPEPRDYPDFTDPREALEIDLDNIHRNPRDYLDSGERTVTGKVIET